MKFKESFKSMFRSFDRMTESFEKMLEDLDDLDVPEGETEELLKGGKGEVTTEATITKPDGTVIKTKTTVRRS